MEAVTSDKGVLKLVHPGPYVEVHTSPITAAEVMEKNPRHCITRPDFFKYPWIVVKPESVLNPGEVFYLVPNYTIYNLQKARESLDQLSRQSNSPFLRGTSPLNTCAGMPPKQRETIHSCEELMRSMSWSEFCPHGQEHGHLRKATRRSPDRLSRQSNKSPCLGGTSPLKPYAGMRAKHRESIHSCEELMRSMFRPELISQEHEHEHEHGRRFISEQSEVIVEYERNSFDLQENYAARIGFCNAREYYSTDSNISSKVPEREDDKETELEQTKVSKQVAELKPCLRKEDSVRKSRHLKVSFVLPNKSEELLKRRRESETEFPGFSFRSLLHDYDNNYLSTRYQVHM